MPKYHNNPPQSLEQLAGRILALIVERNGGDLTVSSRPKAIYADAALELLVDNIEGAYWHPRHKYLAVFPNGTRVYAALSNRDEHFYDRSGIVHIHPGAFELTEFASL